MGSDWPPRWLQVVVNLTLGVGAVVAYIGLFGWGLVLAFTGDSSVDWPTDDETVQTLLSTIGGLAATIFAVAMNLPTDAGIRIRAAQTLSILPPAFRRGSLAEIDWDDLDRKVLVAVGLLLALSYPVLAIAGFVASLARPDETPSFISNFGGPGVGILMTAVALWLGRLARRP